MSVCEYQSISECLADQLPDVIIISPPFNDATDYLEALGCRPVAFLPNLHDGRYGISVNCADRPHFIRVIAAKSVTLADVASQVVCGELPLHLATRAKLMIQIQRLPRGFALGCYQVHQCAGQSFAKTGG